MSFVQALSKKADETRTLNGAKAYASTGDSCLDLFSVAGGMRYRTQADQIRLFDRAYIENPELAMKLLFYIRDIRCGMGERQLFRTLIRHVAKIWPESAKKNVAFISEYGRWDDLFCLMGTKIEKTVVEVIRTQLEKDLDSLSRRDHGDKEAPISLLAKWMPSINTSSARTRGIAKRICTALDMEHKDYRKTMAHLRANICLTEEYLTKGKLEKIRYAAVPAGAMLKYRGAFERKDTDRFSEYLTKVAIGTEAIHSDTLFPYEILRPYIGNDKRDRVK